jgi:MGT family glycosyltransferase
MGRYLFVCHDAGGTIPPVLAMAETLVGRGHQVEILSQPSVEARARQAGCAFVRFTETGDYRRDVALEEQLDLMLPVLAGGAVGTDLLAAVEEFAPNAVMVDPNLAGALASAETLTVPSVVLLHSLLKTFVDVWLGELWSVLAEPINTTRAEFGIDEAASWAEMLSRHELIVSPVPEVFDAPVSPLPDELCYVGFLVPSALPDTLIELPPGDDPVVAVSLSTTFAAQESALDAILEALAAEPVRVVVTTSGYAPATHPANAMVIDFVPHTSLFEHADAVITHGGLGTIAAALRSGVPLVCVPGGRDQPLNASRVAVLGAGVQCAGEPDPDDLRTAVRQVLHDPSFRQAAAGIATASRQLGEAEAAADCVEHLTR